MQHFQSRLSLYVPEHVFTFIVRCVWLTILTDMHANVLKHTQTGWFLPGVVCVYPLVRVYGNSLETVLRSTRERKQLFTRQTTHINKATCCVSVCVCVNGFRVKFSSWPQRSACVMCDQVRAQKHSSGSYTELLSLTNQVYNYNKLTLYTYKPSE